MFAKASAIFAIFTVAARVVVATPPACVLAAINTQDDPSNFKDTCGASEVQQFMSDNCGDHLETAQGYLSDYCKANDATVASAPSSNDNDDDDSSTQSSSGSSPSSSASASASGTQTTSPAGTASSTVPQQTESGAPSSEGGAARLGMDLVGMAALGVFGAMIAL